MAEREVDDVDAELPLVGDRELDRANHVAGAAAAVLIENLEADELHRRRDTFVFDVQQARQAADQTGDVRAVTVVVERRLRLDRRRRVKS